MKYFCQVELCKPKVAYQAAWADLNNDPMQPLSTISLEKLVESTVLLLRAMVHKCKMVPTKLISSDLKVLLVGSELVRWKLKLKEVFVVQEGSKSLHSYYRRTQADMVPVEKKRLELLLDEQVGLRVEDIRPINTPLPKNRRDETRSLHEGGRHPI